MSTLMNVAIVSAEAPVNVGGLAAYQRMLAFGLSEKFGIAGTFMCLRMARRKLRGEPVLPWPVRLIGSMRWGRMHGCMMHLASRRMFHAMLEKLSCAALPSQRLSRAAAGVGAMHFVGTGWDFLGFPVKAAASRIGAKFTILPAVHPLSWGDDAIDIRLYRKADRVFCLSDYEKCHLAKRGVPEEKLIRCGLPPMCRNDGDGRRFRIGIEIAERPAVLFIGRRDKGKGYPALLDAWTLVVKQVPDAVLVLAGPGDSDPVRLAAIPSDSVRDLGIPDELEKANALAATDVFCLPSAHESFGIVYLEAWFYGKPVICGTAPASRELVREGETGLWSDGSPASIAAGIVALLGNGALRNRLGEAGRTLQQSEYTRDSALATHVASFGMADNEPCAFRV